MKTSLQYVYALLCGALLTLSYAPFSIWLLMLVGLAGFLYLLVKNDSAFKTGFAFGLGWFGAGISWVHVSIADFGGLPLAGSLGLMILLCAYLALFPAFFSWCLTRWFSVALWPVVAPAMWFFIEWIRSWLFTGFPWLSVGYSQIDSALGGWVPLIGETGLSMLLVLIATSIAIGLCSKRLAPPAIVLVVTYASGWTLNTFEWVALKSTPVSIAMVQGNIKQEMRWAPEQAQPTMQKYEQMSAAHWSNQLVIWPEAAVPQIEPMAESFLLKLDKQAAASDTGLITGIVNFNYDSKQAFNNLLALGKKHQDDTQGHYHYLHSNRFDKHHLLPIGEFIPFEDWLRKLAPIFDLPMSSFTRGDFLQANLLANGIHLAPAICFEIAFPRQIAANLNSETDFIITVSNDAWFGASHGPDQHLDIARVRAKEFGIPVLRATNNGITAFIDHKGKVISRLPQFEAGVLSHDMLGTIGYTPYRVVGDAPAWLYCLLIFIFSILRRKQQS